MTAASTHESRSLEQREHFTQAHIDIAVLKLTVQYQADQIKAMAEAMKTMGDQLAMMNTLLSEARGGWKVIAAVAGIAGTLGGAVSWLIAHVPLKP